MLPVPLPVSLTVRVRKTFNLLSKLTSRRSAFGLFVDIVNQHRPLVTKVCLSI